MKISKHPKASVSENNPKIVKPEFSSAWGWYEVVIFLVAFAFYANTLSNSYALDDVLAITANKYVQQGTGGIFDIVSHSEWAGATMKKSTEMAGKYRPVSIVAFAIECQVFGNNPKAFHFFNVLWYAILCVVILRFLKNIIFKNNFLLAFCLSLLFAIHPVHTEVVANIKSRDEIFSLLFLLLTLGCLLRYIFTEQVRWLCISVFTFMLSAFSKDYALLFAAGIPAFLYSFTALKNKRIIKLSIPFWIILILYFVIRIYVSSASDSETAIEQIHFPYENYSAFAKAALVFRSLWEYLRLMFCPLHLTYDYSYSYFPSASFGDLNVLASAVTYSSLLFFGFYRLIKKHRDGMFIILYILSLALVSWMLLRFGYLLGERFLFSSGFYFLTATGIIIDKYVPSRFFSQKIILSALVLVSGLAFYNVFERNKVWKNNRTLYFEDVKTSSNSVRAQAFCGMTLVTETDTMTDSTNKVKTLKEALGYFSSAYKIYPGFSSMYHNWGLSYFILGKIDSAQWAWGKYKILKPGSKLIAIEDKALNDYYYNVYFEKYNKAKQENDLKKMLEYYREAVKFMHQEPQAWLLLGELYKLNGIPDSANMAWKKCLELDSGNVQAKEFLAKNPY